MITALPSSIDQVERVFAGEQKDSELLGRLALRLIDAGTPGGRQVGFDHQFVTGDYFRFEVTPSRDGWLYLYHRPPDGPLELLWPARDELKANAVRALEPAMAPSGEDALRFEGETGEESFYVALVSQPSAAPTTREVEERMGRIETLIERDQHVSAAGDQRRGVVVARPGDTPYLYFEASDDDTAAVELRLQHGR